MFRKQKNREAISAWDFADETPYCHGRIFSFAAYTGSSLQRSVNEISSKTAEINDLNLIITKIKRERRFILSL